MMIRWKATKLKFGWIWQVSLLNKTKILKKFYLIKFFLDRQTGYLIQQQMYEAYFNFSNQILEDCGENPKVAMIPISFNEPVFGRLDSNYGTFIAPGVIVT